MLSCKLLMIGQTKFLYNLGKSMVVNKLYEVELELFTHIGQLMIIDASSLYLFNLEQNKHLFFDVDKFNHVDRKWENIHHARRD